MNLHTTAFEHVFELPATAAAAGLARRELAATPGVAGELSYQALLMTSELIAVYVQDVEPRPDATLRLSIRVTPARVRIEVGGRPLGMSTDELLSSRETSATRLRELEREAEQTQARLDAYVAERSRGT